MPFIRLSDNYIDHPKFLALSASAFRLWHEGMAFCRKHQTDGRLPASTVKGFRYYKGPAMTELLTPYQPAAHALWETIAGFGYQVHDYLDWNLSKDEEDADRDAAAIRMRRLRQGRKAALSSPERSYEHMGERSPIVPDRREIGSGSFPERESEGKPIFRRPGESIAYEPVPEELQERAARLVERYAELFCQHRLGAKYRSKPSPDYEDAKTLVPLWTDARLEKLAVLVLTTDDPWISRTDRSFKIFALKASWADDKLRAWETEHGVAV